MTEVRIGDQIIRFDREATIAIYANEKNGWAEDCLCAGCQNLMAQREYAYPIPFLDLLNRLGIEPAKEAETVANGPLESGLHQYEGRFFFVGEMVSAGEQMIQLADSPYFAFFFTTGGPRPPAFLSVPTLAVEFLAHLKWVLPDQ